MNEPRPQTTMRRLAIPAALALSFGAAWAQSAPPEPPPEPPRSSWAKKLFVGGSAGLSFGTVDSVTIAPLVGYRVVPRFSLGAQPFYRYAKYKDFSPDVTTHDYGVDVFGRFRVVGGFFLQAQYEWIDYDAVTFAGTTERQSGSYWFGGAGYSVGAGPVGVYFVALYDFTYDANDPLRPYDNPWIIQAGVAVGF